MNLYRPLILALAAALAAPAWAQPEAPPAPAARQPAPTRFRPPCPVTRADLGVAYLELDAALAKLHPDADSIRRANKEFDDLTMLFFAGNFSAATQRVHALTRSLNGQDDAPAARLARSLKVTVDPPVIVLDRDRSVSIRITSMYPVDVNPASPVTLTVVLREPPGAPAVTHAFALDAADRVDVARDNLALPVTLVPGRYEVRIRAGDGPERIAGWWTVTGKPLADRKRAVLSTLENSLRAHPELKLQIGICRARAELLTDRPGEASSAEFLLNLDHHAFEVESESSRLLRGEAAYPNGSGAWWMGVPIDDASVIPARVYAPMRPERAGQVRPLVIALHGAGGDEMMFFEGYGQGRIMGLADQHDFVVVAPRTEILLGNPANFDRLVDAVASVYPVDASRIFVIGHSMGAGAASLATARADRIAAAVCIAGGPLFPPHSSAPLLLFEAELDGLMSADRFEKMAERAREGGADVRFELVKDWGHTLVVGHILPRAVEAMLRIERPAPRRFVPGEWNR